MFDDNAWIAVTDWSKFTVLNASNAEMLVLANFFSMRNVADNLARIVGVPAGHVVHVAPKNVDTTFMYVVLMSALCGNTNTVRLTSNIEVRARQQALVDSVNEYLPGPIEVVPLHAVKDVSLIDCDVRVIWGGDDTIKTIRAENPILAHTREIVFHDKRSIAVIDGSFEGIDELASDITWMHQQSCTSVRGVVWVNRNVSQQIELMSLVRKANLAGAVERLSYQQALFARGAYTLSGLRPGEAMIETVSIERFATKVTECTTPGILFASFVDDVKELDKMTFADHKLQTVVCSDGVREGVVNHALSRPWCDRIVKPGQSMKFDWTWDGYDLVEHLTRRVQT